MSAETTRQPLTAAAWQAALDRIARGLTRRGLTHEIGGGVVWVDKPEGAATWALADLREILSAAPEAQHASLVGHWVRIALQRDDAVDLKDFAQVQDRLRLRLAPHDDDAGPLVAMPVMPGMDAVLVVDLPEAIVAVRPAQLAAWGLEGREAMGIGLHHVVRTPAKEEVLEGPAGAPIHVHTGPSAYVAARALALEQWVDAEHGAFVAVPNQHTLLFRPITDRRAPALVQALHHLAAKPFEAGPGALSPGVYWWLPGRFAEVQVVADGTTGATGLRFPESFQDVLAALPEPAPQESP